MIFIINPWMASTSQCHDRAIVAPALIILHMHSNSESDRSRINYKSWRQLASALKIAPDPASTCSEDVFLRLQVVIK